jgi:hypothetical protein
MPNIFRQYVEGASAITPIPNPTGVWAYTLGDAVILVEIPSGGMPFLRVIGGLAVGVPFSSALAQYVNGQNRGALVFGRMALAGDFPADIPAGGAWSHVLVEHFVDGEGLTYEVPSSIQSLIYAMSSHGSQMADRATEIVQRFGGRYFKDDEAPIVHQMFLEGLREAQ